MANGAVAWRVAAPLRRRSVRWPRPANTMAKPFWFIEGKLLEADFFLDRIRRCASLDEARYYFSAFATAARSVTFAMQACLSGDPRFDTWYAALQDRLRNDALAKYFVKVRNELQKLGFNPLAAASFGYEPNVWFHLVDDAPEMNVIIAANGYMAQLVTAVRDVYRLFYPMVNFPFTSLADLQAASVCMEDIEEQVGLPRGWTASANPPERRLQDLIGLTRSEIGRLITKYGTAAG